MLPKLLLLFPQRNAILSGHARRSFVVDIIVPHSPTPGLFFLVSAPVKDQMALIIIRLTFLYRIESTANLFLAFDSALDQWELCKHAIAQQYAYIYFHEGKYVRKMQKNCASAAVAVIPIYDRTAIVGVEDYVNSRSLGCMDQHLSCLAVIEDLLDLQDEECLLATESLVFHFIPAYYCWTCVPLDPL